MRKGTRLFAEGESIPLELIWSETFTTGVLNLLYAGTAPDVTPPEALAPN